MYDWDQKMYGCMIKHESGEKVQKHGDSSKWLPSTPEGQRPNWASHLLWLVYQMVPHLYTNPESIYTGLCSGYFLHHFHQLQKFHTLRLLVI